MRSVVVYLGVAVGLLGYLFIARDMCLWPWPSVLKFPSIVMLASSMYLVFPIVGAIPGALFFSVRGILRRKNRQALLADYSRAAISLAFIPLALAVLVWGEYRRNAAFIRAAANGDQLVDALRNYHDNCGIYPEALEELVPQYIPAIPTTGMVGYPEFIYRPGYNDFDEVDDSYELVVYCGSGILNFDRFIYWTSETYPQQIQSSWTQKIGTWAYLHE